MNVPVDVGSLIESSPLVAVGGRPRVPLADYQEEARDTLAGVALDTLAKIRSAPDRRRDIAMAQGVMLLSAPTGSGKTLTASRTIERIVGATLRPTVWFWWTPYSGLVAQTRAAFEAHSPTLRVRDLATDRIPADTRDGDVFVATWASVSSRSRTLSARKSSEDAPSIDLLLEWLRVEGWNIGAVIDEAHVNFGMSATEAAAFYLDVLKPDVTMLCTATPRDEELLRFCRAAGIGAVNRVEIARDRVVDAGLNKVGVKAVRLQAATEDKEIIDLGEAALGEGLERHRIIKTELAAQGVSLVPLMLVQVENAKTNESVDRAYDFLVRQGVPPEAIAKHTSGDPDPYFHMLAYDESREVLIFKVSAATGFDAPRAWTLVSLRQTMDRQFGLQVLGRIVRVHPRVRHLHPRLGGRTEPSILDYGYAFLATPEQQPGLVEAASRMKAFHDEVSTITDKVVVYSSLGGAVALVRPEDGFADLLVPDRGPGIDGLEHGLSSSGPGQRTSTDLPHSALQRALDLGIRRGSATISASPADFTLRPTPGPKAPARPKPLHVYPLREDVSFPRTFAREVMPDKVDALADCIGRRFAFDAEALALVNRTYGRVQITEEDLFATVRTQERRQADVLLSAEKIAAHAQMSFRFNDYIDDQKLRDILKERLHKKLLELRWQKVDDHKLRRAVDLIVMARPDLLHDACRACLAEHSVILQDQPIPAAIEDEDILEPAIRNLYGVFPKGLNKEELAFARRIDEEESGTVVWWTRNVSMARWAVSIVRPNGRLHYPDFVIGVDARRKTEDGIALVEIKDDGSDGRLFSEGNSEKVRTEHRRYGTALMLFRDSRGRWTQAVYRSDPGRLIHGNRFEIDDLIHARG